MSDLESRGSRVHDVLPPRRFRRGIQIDLERSQEWPVFTVRHRRHNPRGAVVYVYGGAWAHGIASSHWRLASEIAAEAPVAVVLPIYPSIPKGTVENVVPKIAQVVLEAWSRYGVACLAGDSAGGEIALLAALGLRDLHNLALPRTVLISPVLDVSLQNPEIRAAQDHDPWLGTEGLRVFADQWRGRLDSTDPRVSPLFAELRGLGPLTVFSGTRDILNPDARLLVRKAAALGIEVDYHEGLGLVHTYPLTRTREGAAAREIIIQRLREASEGSELASTLR